MVAQKPVELHVLESISCCRITLKNVSENINFSQKNEIQNQIELNYVFI